MWFVLSLLAGFLFAVNKLIVRVALSKNVKPLAFGAFHELLAGIFLLPLAFFHISFPQTSDVWIAIILGMILLFLKYHYSQPLLWKKLHELPL